MNQIYIHHLENNILSLRIYNVLNAATGIIDVKKVKLVPKTGGVYSSDYLEFDDIMSRDGTYIMTPKNVILELKYPLLDIKGVIK